jgi:predicted transposase/invertase (TIGR01784 family)
MLAPLDNGTIFKTAFTDKTVFTQFVKDILGIDIEVDKIETEKKFEPKIGNIDITLDIFAESTDHRVIIEIQRIDYDYNFDRFLHYFMMAIAQLQKSAAEYTIEQTVYAIVVLTAPYKIEQKNHKPIKDEVMITSLDPRNLEDEIIQVYGHKLIFLNHCYRDEKTPVNYRDWLDLFYESIHNPANYKVNLNNRGIKKAVELIEYERLSPEQLHLVKVDSQRKVVRQLDREEAIKEGLEMGKIEGAENEKLKIVRQSLKEGLPVELIAKITGLSKEEIEKFSR